jgi:hypothetical protein
LQLTFKIELMSLVAASHWSVCFLWRVIVVSSARASNSMCFSLTNSSYTLLHPSIGQVHKEVSHAHRSSQGIVLGFL